MRPHRSTSLTTLPNYPKKTIYLCTAVDSFYIYFLIIFVTKQTSPFILLGIGVLASVGYFYVGPKLFGKKLNESPFIPFPPQQAVTSQGPPL